MQCLSSCLPEASFTTTNLTNFPSLLTDSTRANGHLSLTVISSQTNTNCPTYKFLFSPFHFVRFCSVCKYSFVHLSQNESTRLRVFLQLYLRLSAPGGRGGKMLMLECWMTFGYKKFAGQSGVRSLISELAYVRGLQFITRSTSTKAVVNTSKSCLSFVRIKERCFFS